ncbi:MAG: polysaccharide biosynthesis protein, partial [Gammaproteobacteria bacterium]|nr:polysaccharide biosynthesis protein [Gammaproteobacteria bacterium]
VEKKALIGIYGAGRAGVQLAKALLAGNQYQPAFFVDDNKDLHKNELFGIRVFSPKELEKLISEFEVEQVFLAIPSLTRQRRRLILDELESLSVQIKTLPGIEDIAAGRVTIDDIRNVDIEDLLGRDPVPPITDLLKKCIEGKSVLVTGAGGSIGSELCRQILGLKPTKIVLFENHEFSLYQIERELRNRRESSIEIVPILGTIMNKDLLRQVVEGHAISTIYHAAAYKHVPIVEFNPLEGVLNNVFGTRNVAEVARECRVETFVLISTDKAVRPTNIMGASKRLAELILQAMALESKATRYVMVRFGNVLGSSGSVIPLFKEQIKKGGPITVTHPEVTRYFMTIPEAAQLVLQAGSMGSGGDVFVLDMGESVKIYELAKKMVHLSGMQVNCEETPDGEIAIEFTGLRPGEKLYEELLIGNNVSRTEHPRILRAEESYLSKSEIGLVLDLLIRSIDVHNVEDVRRILHDSILGQMPISFEALLSYNEYLQ